MKLLFFWVWIFGLLRLLRLLKLLMIFLRMFFSVMMLIILLYLLIIMLIWCFFFWKFINWVDSGVFFGMKYGFMQVWWRFFLVRWFWVSRCVIWCMCMIFLIWLMLLWQIGRWVWLVVCNCLMMILSLLLRLMFLILLCGIIRLLIVIFFRFSRLSSMLCWLILLVWGLLVGCRVFLLWLCLLLFCFVVVMLSRCSSVLFSRVSSYSRGQYRCCRIRSGRLSGRVMCFE